MPHLEMEIGPQSNIAELVRDLPIAAEVLGKFGLHCAGCGVNKYETIEQGAKAHGLRIEPIIAALVQARLSGFVPNISNEDRIPLRRAPGEFKRHGKIKHVVPIMSGKGGVGKSLVTALVALGLRRRNLRVGILDADITGPSIPKLFGLRTPLLLEVDPNAKPAPQGASAPPLMVPAQSRTAIEIVSDKTADSFRRLFARHAVASECCAMAGDSIRSDVLPALEAGAWAALVPHDIVWFYERAVPPAQHPRFTHLQAFTDLPAWIDAIA